MNGCILIDDVDAIFHYRVMRFDYHHNNSSKIWINDYAGERYGEGSLPSLREGDFLFFLLGWMVRAAHFSFL